MYPENTQFYPEKKSEFRTLSRRKFLQAATALVLGSISGRGFAQPSDIVTLESRAILDEGLHWIVKTGEDKTVVRLCERIKRAGFNVFVPNVWHGRGTCWPTNLAPWDDRFPQPVGFDPLGHLIKVAAQYDLEIHPWFNVGLRQRDFYPEFTDPKIPSASFNFHNPQFRTFIVNLVLDVVERYPVQGINLDFVRFDVPQPGHETDQEAVVADVVRRISMRAKAINSNIVISADAAPWYPTIKQFGQDAPKWADEGIIDVIYSMQYQYNPDFATTSQIQSKLKRPEAMVVMVGNYDEVGSGATSKVIPRDPKRLSELIAEARKLAKGNGVAVYYYGMFNDEQLEYLRSTVFAMPAIPSWKRASYDTAPPKAPRDVLIR